MTIWIKPKTMIICVCECLLFFLSDVSRKSYYSASLSLAWNYFEFNYAGWTTYTHTHTYSYPFIINLHFFTYKFDSFHFNSFRLFGIHWRWFRLFFFVVNCYLLLHVEMKKWPNATAEQGRERRNNRIILYDFCFHWILCVFPNWNSWREKKTHSSQWIWLDYKWCVSRTNDRPTDRPTKWSTSSFIRRRFWTIWLPHASSSIHAHFPCLNWLAKWKGSFIVGLNWNGFFFFTLSMDFYWPVAQPHQNVAINRGFHHQRKQKINILIWWPCIQSGPRTMDF